MFSYYFQFIFSRVGILKRRICNFCKSGEGLFELLEYSMLSSDEYKEKLVFSRVNSCN